MLLAQPKDRVDSGRFKASLTVAASSWPLVSGKGVSLALQAVTPRHHLQFAADGFLHRNDGARLEYERGQH
jgi:hypothetical protein